MAIKYKTTRYGIDIDPVEIIRETAACVFVHDKYTKRERKEHKTSEFHTYHDTWDAAHRHLLEVTGIRISNAKSDLGYLEGQLDRIASMQPPATPNKTNED